MIIAKIQGGLGNQLFQYAFARALAKKHNTSLKLDTSFYANYQSATPRHFLLQHFNIKYNEIASLSEIKQIKDRKSTILNKVFRKILPTFCSSYKEDNIVFDTKALKLSNNVWVEGYWQNSLYFEHIADELRSEFMLNHNMESAESLLNEIESVNSVSIHYRRTDYCRLGLDSICNNEYYTKAINQVTSKIADPVFYVFSDDIEWVKENVKLGYKTIYVSQPDYVELILMSGCKNNIIANSSFSWWGAWLNKHAEKMVIAPKKWHNPKAASVIYPKGWVLIDS